MPARKKIPGKKQIIRLIQSVARKLGRTPIQAEFVRMSRIDVAVIRRRFGKFPSAVRAAGMVPNKGLKIDSATLLQNWAEVVRRLGHIPTFREYAQLGRYCTTIVQKRFRRWAMIPEAFAHFVETGSLNGEWTDVIEIIRQSAIAAKEKGYGAYHRSLSGLVPTRPVLPVAVAGMRCVTPTMLGAFVAQVTGIQFWNNGFIFNRRVLPDRPLLGPPMQRTAMSHEPVNEMGVIILFAMWAERLGFVIEFAQVKFPDCKAKM